ncbi:MAG TPA: acyl-CoA dehydrogenase family protein [Nocardioides sp.]|nr:acyl-CoA dehydrogenase family protein [Nocardioides sp.]
MNGLFPDYAPVWETEDHRLLRKHAATFLAREATPHQDRWAEQHAVDRDFWTKAGAAGLLCLDIDEEYGGGGGNFGHEAVVAHERSIAHDTAFGFEVHSTIVSHYVAAYGSEEIKQRYLPQLVSGEKVIGIAMTEPDTGSDLQAVRTTARREGDHYVINGSKTFISNATHADLMVIVAKTDTSQGARGISLFLAEVSDDTPGFTRGRVLQKIGQHGQDTRELAFDDLRVPAANLLGDGEGQGFFQLMNQLPRERLILGVNGVAMAEAAVTEAIRYAKERQAFGQPILDFQNTRFVLAECKTQVLAARTFIDHCVQRAIDGTLDAATASMAKLHGTETQVEVVDRCLQVFGGYGYMMEYPIARMYAAARVQKIYGGTNEIMKELIGRSL